ncbi:uncharacterized protein DS421_4g108290 [Arachis hypogaea]|nr:uncharacterized protein DS421_4g108290 [Arachis hypogaea]
MSQPRFTSMTLVVLLLLVLFCPCNSLSSSSMDLNTSDLNAVSRRVCRKSIVECLAENEMMDSESNRRILAMQQQKRRQLLIPEFECNEKSIPSYGWY